MTAASLTEICCPAYWDSFPDDHFPRMGWENLGGGITGFKTECPQCSVRFTVQTIQLFLYVSPEHIKRDIKNGNSA